MRIRLFRFADRLLELLSRYRVPVLALATALIVLTSLGDAIGITSTVHAMTSDTWASMYADSGGNYFVAAAWWVSYQGGRLVDSALGVFGYCIVNINGTCG